MSSLTESRNQSGAEEVEVHTVMDLHTTIEDSMMVLTTVLTDSKGLMVVHTASTVLMVLTRAASRKITESLIFMFY